MAHIWERQPGETTKQYYAFNRYLRDGEERAILKAACAFVVDHPERQVSNVERLWRRWSSRWNWVDRACAYDDHTLTEERAHFERRRKKLAIRRIETEITRQDLIDELIESLFAVFQKAVTMPLTDVEQHKFDAQGRVVSHQRIRGVRLESLAKLSAEICETIARAVNGHVRIHKSIRAEADVNGMSGTATVRLELAEGQWPDEEPS